VLLLLLPECTGEETELLGEEILELEPWEESEIYCVGMGIALGGGCGCCEGGEC
jgi:hypothetical protein